MAKNLALFAHPDDEALACGGLIAQHPEDWHVAVLADGVTSRDGGATWQQLGQPVPAPTVSNFRTRHTHFEAAMRVLGVTSYESRGLPDQRLDSLDFLDLAKGVTEIIDRVNPSAVYTHFQGDLNRDHRLVCEAVHVACRPPKRIALYECEVLSSTEWGIGTPFQPNVFVDITATIVTKLAAFGQYADESRPFPHPRSPESLRARAQSWGSMAGVLWAEAFRLVREVR